ncbi:hypothetical protein PCANC_24909 [Puccinia coronata f. sp. avenae]|uniref:Uncharacterized protein n=1 Tax=Puccinia coronata f. sp. avenae TaxID=200324 RepID=A0A2N5U3P6_9BASI|nr:hypothetical protein PCANC_24909 [Puccinia coronata f. sp. avenae]
MARIYHLSNKPPPPPPPPENSSAPSRELLSNKTLSNNVQNSKQWRLEQQHSQVDVLAAKTKTAAAGKQQLGTYAETPQLPSAKGELPIGPVTSKRSAAILHPTSSGCGDTLSAQAHASIGHVHDHPDGNGVTLLSGPPLTPNLAALEHLCRAREQLAPPDGPRQSGPIDRGTSSLRPPLRSNPLGDQLQSRIDSPSFDSTHSCPQTSGQTGVLSLQKRNTSATPSQRIGVSYSRLEPDDLEGLLGTRRMLEILEGWEQDLTMHPLAPHHLIPAHQQRLLMPNGQYMHPDIDMQMRPATALQHQAQQTHPPHLQAPVPTRPATGHLVLQMPAAPPIPPHPDNQIHQQQQMVPHHQAHSYYANPPNQPQPEYQQQAQYPPPQGRLQYQGQLQYTGPQYHRPYQRNQENSWHRCYNPMASMMQMGTFFMRVESTMSRMQRLRHRGRSYRGNYGNNQPPPPPGNFQ